MPTVWSACSYGRRRESDGKDVADARKRITRRQIAAAALLSEANPKRNMIPHAVELLPNHTLEPRSYIPIPFEVCIGFVRYHTLEYENVRY